MRLLKLLLAGIVVAVAMVAGLLAIVVIATSALALVGARRLRGRGTRTAAASSTVPSAATGEIIDVSATELPAGPSAR